MSDDPRARARKQLDQSDKARASAEDQRAEAWASRAAAPDPKEDLMIRAALLDLLAVNSLEQVSVQRVGQWQAAARSVLRQLDPGQPADPGPSGPSTPPDPEA